MKYGVALKMAKAPVLPLEHGLLEVEAANEAEAVKKAMNQFFNEFPGGKAGLVAVNQI